MKQSSLRTTMHLAIPFSSYPSQNRLAQPPRRFRTQQRLHHPRLYNGVATMPLKYPSLRWTTSSTMVASTMDSIGESLVRFVELGVHGANDIKPRKVVSRSKLWQFVLCDISRLIHDDLWPTTPETIHSLC
jgi:hypothetical protein